MDRPIRNSAKALIIKDGKILVSKIDDNGEIYYVMPGGGQESEELLTEAVKREVAEEAGILIEPKSLKFVVEGLDGEPFHRVDLVFLCEYIGEIKNIEIQGDRNQVGLEWIAIDNLKTVLFYPSKLREPIIRFYHNEETEVYLS